MSILILEHNSSYGGYQTGRQMESFHIKIYFDGIYYQCEFYANTPGQFGTISGISTFDNIPYIQKSTLQIIKIINLSPYLYVRDIHATLKQIFTIPLTVDEINLKNNGLEKVINDLKKQNDDLKKQNDDLKKQNDDLNTKKELEMDTFKNNSKLELDKIQLEMDTFKNNSKLELDKIQLDIKNNSKIEFDRLHMTNLIKNNEIISEFRETINRNCETINNEKLINKNLNNELKDIKLLYENLLTRSCA